ncbi:MAG: zinc ribbon domain-containing protein [Desulfovibrio sp.]
MPLYEYRCRTCGQSFEDLVRNAEDEAALVCPACGAKEPERCLSACAVRVGGGTGSGDFAASAPPMPGGCGGGGGFS